MCLSEPIRYVMMYTCGLELILTKCDRCSLTLLLLNASANGITYSTVGSYCGETEFEGYTYGTSDGGSLVFEFTTDLSRQFEGFRVHFVAVGKFNNSRCTC